MEIDKLIELIENEEGELAFIIAKGLGLSMELLNTFWDTKRGGEDKHGMLYIKGLCLEWDNTCRKWYCDMGVSTDFGYADIVCGTFNSNEKTEAFKLFINELDKRSE